MEKPSHDAGPPSHTGRGLARSAGLIGIATLTSRVLGLVRDQVLAFFFGAGDAMDAYNVAFRIPTLMRDLFAEGAMTAAFVPTFTRHLTLRGREDAWRLGNNVINALVLVTGGLVLLGIIFAYPLTLAFASDYANVPGKLELTVFLTRIMFPFLTLVALAAAAMGMLNALHRFFIPALSPTMFNVGTIACVMVLVPVMRALGLPLITSVALGTLVGGFGQFAIQWPALRKEGFRYRPILDFKDPGVREILLLMGPGTLGLAATQLNLFVNTVLATGQGTGAVSWLNFAFRLMYLPIGLFGVSIATAAVPSISRQAAQLDHAAMRRTISAGLRLMLMLNVPATVGLIVLAHPIVQLLLQRGRFTSADTAATAVALMAYAPGLIGYSAVKIGVPSFYALGDSRTPVIVSISSVAINAALNITLARVLGYWGLALGTAISALINATLLLSLLRKKIGGLDGARLATATAKICAASCAMGVVAFFVERALRTAIPATGLVSNAVVVFTAIIAALVALAVSARLLRIEEFDDAMRAVGRRFLPGQKATGDT